MVSLATQEVDRRLKRLAMARIGRALQGMPQRDGVEGEREERGDGEGDAMITVVFSPAKNGLVPAHNLVLQTFFLQAHIQSEVPLLTAPHVLARWWRNLWYLRDYTCFALA